MIKFFFLTIYSRFFQEFFQPPTKNDQQKRDRFVGSVFFQFKQSSFFGVYDVVCTTSAKSKFTAIMEKKNERNRKKEIK